MSSGGSSGSSGGGGGSGGVRDGSVVRTQERSNYTDHSHNKDVIYKSDRYVKTSDPGKHRHDFYEVSRDRDTGKVTYREGSVTRDNAKPK